MTRHAVALAQGEAVASGITNTGWRQHLGHTEVPEVSPEKAGRTLVRLAGHADLTFFAHYSTDQAGHRGGMPGAKEALERVDSFLGAVIGALRDDTTVVVASDHGNIEDVGAGHTRNPVLGLYIDARRGVAAPAMTSILDVPGAILSLLESEA